MNAGASARLCPLLLAIAGCGGDVELPPLVASSQYIAYHTDVDASVICMDDLLEREDRFIERTAELLGVDPPSEIINFVWDPVLDGSAPWACATGTDCYRFRGKDDVSIVVSTGLSNHHELVHAVEIPALGAVAHRTLGEGLAEYLGTLKQTAFVPDDFPATFRAMLAEGRQPSDYRLAMHFVGSIFARHGAAKYKALREKMPADASLEQFAAVFEAEYGQSLDNALLDMAGDRVQGNDLFSGCGEDEAPELAWTSEGLIDTTIDSACGDPWFFGAGFDDRGRSGFFGYYVIHVPEAGDYALTVSSVAGAPAPLRGLLTACTYTPSSLGSFGGQIAQKALLPGRHTLLIAFPQRPEARGQATVRLERVAPAP